MGKKTRRTAFPANSQRHAAAVIESHAGHESAPAHDDHHHETHHETHHDTHASTASTHQGDHHHESEDNAQS